MTLTDLIAALEAADGPSRELDGRIYCALNDGFAPSPAPYHGMVERYRGKSVRPVIIETSAYTASLDAALTLVPEKMGWGIDCGSPTAYRARIGVLISGPFVRSVDARAATPAIALCIAALKAREAKE